MKKHRWRGGDACQGIRERESWVILVVGGGVESGWVTSNDETLDNTKHKAAVKNPNLVQKRLYFEPSSAVYDRKMSCKLLRQLQRHS